MSGLVSLINNDIQFRILPYNTALFKCHISVVLQFEHQNHSKDLFKPRAGLCPRDSASAGLGWGLIIGLSSRKVSGDADAAGPGTALRIKATEAEEKCACVFYHLFAEPPVSLCCISSGYDIVGTFKRVKQNVAGRRG